MIQKVENIVSHCLATHNKLEASLHGLSRTGDVQACKAARKSADGVLKELSKELKPLISFLQSSSQAGHILPKVQSLYFLQFSIDKIECCPQLPSTIFC